MLTFRSSLATTRRGLDFDAFPMRLFQKAKRFGVWDPSEIDFTQDAAEWAALADDERDLLLRLTAQFLGGEEAVTMDLLPFLRLAAEEGRIEEELFLTSYLWEEAKHVEAFARFLDQVTGHRGGLEPFFGEAYRRMFFEEQPRALGRLWTDHSAEAVADAAVTYQMITEGVLAETGYHAYHTVLKENDLLPGMRRMIQLIQQDESRHIAYGVFLLSRLVAEHGEPVWAVVEARMSALLGTALAAVAETLAPYGDHAPFGLTPEPFVAFASTQFSKRYDRIAQARKGDAALF